MSQVPGWMGQYGRLAMLDAAKIADIPVLSLMNDHAAVSAKEPASPSRPPSH